MQLTWKDIIRLRSRPLLLFAIGLLAVHILLVPILFAVSYLLVERNIQDSFEREAQSFANLVGHFISLELMENEKYDIVGMLDIALQHRDTVFADVRSDDGVILARSQPIKVDPDQFRTDYECSQHDDNVYCPTVPLTTSSGVRHGTLRLGYDETVAKERSHRAFRQIFEFVAGYVLFLLAAHGYLFWVVDRAQDTIAFQGKTISDRNRELEQLSKELLYAQELERKRIARELHDSTCQSLSAIKMRVENLANPDESAGGRRQSDNLARISSMVQDAIDEVRRMILAVRPPMLDNLGLVSTISWFCREFHTTHPTIEVVRNTDILEEEIPEGLKNPIFRILQEACTNVAKHSGATLLRVTLRRVKNNIELLVEDNGKGLKDVDGKPKEPAYRGFGRISMRERAELSGGQLVLRSNTDSGLTVQGTWPVRLTS